MDLKELDWFRAEVERLAAVIDAPPEYLPTYGYSKDFARSHVEFRDGRYHFVVGEGGRELERVSSVDPRDILYEVFEAITFTMAGDHEVRRRRPGEDSRRQLFAVQLQLLGLLSEEWRERTRAHLDEVLRLHPFSDGG